MRNGIGWLLLLLVWSFVVPVRAQDVETDHSAVGSLSRTGNAAAETQGRGDWADVRNDEPGTHVILSADLRNADVILVTRKSFGEAALLAEAKKIVTALALPKTDLIIYDGGKRVAMVDLEFNDYLEMPDKSHTRFSVPLSRLRDALNDSSLPRPIVFFVEGDRVALGSVTVVDATTGRATRKLTGDTFLSLTEIPANTNLLWEITIPWYGYISAMILAVLFISPVPILWRSLQRQQKLATPTPDPVVPDPAEVQKQYNKMPPFWLLAAGIPLVGTLIPVFFRSSINQAFSAATSVYQSLGVPLRLLPIGMIVFNMLLFGGFFLWQRFGSGKKSVNGSAETNDDTIPTWTTTIFMAPLIFGLFVMLFLLVNPFNVTPEMKQIILVGIGVGIVAGLIGIPLYTRRFTHRKLAAGDPLYDMVQQMADSAGVKVRGVEIIRSPALNAYATLWGTVGFTSKLARTFDDDEKRIIIAHELAHHRAADPRRQVLFGLLISVAFWGAWYYGTEWLIAQHYFPANLRILLNSPIVFVMLLPLLRSFLMGKTQRRAEELADQYAVDVTGDAEKVIQTLEKIHTQNGSPHQLKPSDEAISSHPSFANRMAAIRRYASRD